MQFVITKICYQIGNYFSLQEDLSKETLVDQFRIVKNETNTSHVLQFGDKSMKHDPLNMYQGQGNVPFKPVRLPKVPVSILCRLFQL